MSRSMLATGVCLILFSFGVAGTASADDGEPSPPVETTPQAEPPIRRTVSVPVRSVPEQTKSKVVVPTRVYTKYEVVPVRTYLVANETHPIQMDLVIVELRGNLQRALKDADFHESPGGHRYTSATANNSGRESEWLKTQLQTMNSSAEVNVLSRPQVRSVLGQPAEIQVGCGTPQITYLVRTGKKTFELREAVAQPTLGVTISLTAQTVAEDPEQIEISPLKISTTTFDGREPIPGVDLDVGKPIISTRKLETSIRVTDGGETSGIVLPGPSGRHAILFISVRRVAKVDRHIFLTKPVVEPDSSPATSPKPNP